MRFPLKRRQLGLIWADVDFDGGVVHVRRQLDRSGVHPVAPIAESFSFTVAPQGETWEVRAGGNITRTITRVQEIFDVCCTSSGQYPQADSAARTLAIAYAVAQGYIRDPDVERAKLALIKEAHRDLSRCGA